MFTVFLILLCVLAVLVLARGVRMPGRSHSGPLAPLSDREEKLRAALEAHVHKLAQEIGERNYWYDANLEAAAAYIRHTWNSMGYDVGVQEYLLEKKPMRNLEVEVPGSALRDEIVVVGAHYDSVIGSPGANDNASGVAALLELARLFAAAKPARTVRFVAFVNEEPPFFQTRDMGSRVYARRSAKRGEKVVAMLSLETIGCYSNERGSQRYPFPFKLFYPDTGNFIGFVGNLASRNLVRRSIAVFRSSTAFPSQGLAAPGWVVGVGWSDQWSFWREGYPAIMVTDTALFRYRAYHTEADTAEKVDCNALARVVQGLFHVLQELAQGASARY